MKRHRLLAACAIGLVACSTAFEPPPLDSCRQDADCSDGDICGPQGFCLDAKELPPLAYMGFDIQESRGGAPQYRVEVLGCDQEIESQEILAISRSVVSQTLLLSAVSVDASDPDADPMPMPATFELSQASRLARPPGIRRTVVHPMPEGEMSEFANILWPRYRPENRQPNPQLEGGGFVLWSITPQAAEGEPDRAPMLVMLTPPPVKEGTACDDEDNPCEDGDECVNYNGMLVCRPAQNPETLYRDIRYQTVCERPLRGQVSWIRDGVRGAVVPNVNATVRYGKGPDGDRFGIPASANEALEDRDPQCSTDADCIPDVQYCDPDSRQCFLHLTGRPAASASATPATNDEGWFATRVYTYCEGQTATQIRRQYVVTLSDHPDNAATRVVSSINYDPEVSFSPPLGPGDKPAGNIDGHLCIPDLGPPLSMRIEMNGAPMTLARSQTNEPYTCCDISCLPETLERAEQMAPAPNASCTGLTRTTLPTLRFESPIILSPQEGNDWLDAGCILPILSDPDRSIGVLARSASCSEETEVCEVVGLAGGPDGSSRTYRLRVESPTGSLFRSTDEDVVVDAGVSEVEVELQRRVLVHGRVMLPEPCPASAEDCAADRAFVLAERLRLSKLEPRPPGPHFHQVSTYHDPAELTAGHYILPLDPGVWIVTALPATGTAGGPAAYTVLDLRDESDREHDFLLEQGTPVRLRLVGFDLRATVGPIDTGTWRDAPLEHPDRPEEPIDLGAIGECWGDDSQACRIRRLFPVVPLPASQVGQVSFNARLAPGNAARSCIWPD